MIINVTYGGSASDAARYIQGAAKEHGRDVAGTEDRTTLLGGQGFGFPLETRDDVCLALDVLRRDVELQASNTKPVQNTVIHASMSWPQGYEPSREEMLEAADHLAKAWGIEAHRRISWRHSETEHRHIHTLFGSIHPDTGYAHHDHELNDRAQRAAIDWEREHGIPPTRQKDHDKAAAAEASDHARTLELSKNTDGSISRRSLDRALSLGGWFRSDKAAQRAEFIAHHDLTRFPAQEFGYSSKPLAEEKAEYIRQNRDLSSNLTRAYDREAKERAAGVFRLYEDHSFERTSKPPAQEERERDMGIFDGLRKRVNDWQHNRAILDGMNNPDNYMSRAQQEEFKRESGMDWEDRVNNALDWPWKKIGVKKYTDKWQDWLDERRYRGTEVQRHNGTTVYPDWFNKREIKRYEDYEKRSAARNRGFGKEVEEKGWDDPEVKRQWEKRYGPAEYVQDQEKKETKEAETAEEGRVQNWKTQRERNHDPVRSGEVPPWNKDAQRSDVWRREQEMQKEEADSRPLPETRLQKHWREQWARPRPDAPQHLPEQLQQSRHTPALPRPQEIPMPKDQQRQDWWRDNGLDTSRLHAAGMKAAAERAERAQQNQETQPQGKQEEKPMDKWKDWLEPEGHEVTSDPGLKNGPPAGRGYDREPSEHPDISRARDLARDISNTGPGAALPPIDRERSSREWDETLDKREEGLRKSWPDPERSGNKDTRTPRQIAQDEHGMIGKQIPDSSREFEDRHRQRAEDYYREESPKDGTAGEGRRDDTEAGKPGILPGGSHEHGSPSEQFRRQLDESLRDIKPPEREIGKDREREH